MTPCPSKSKEKSITEKICCQFFPRQLVTQFPLQDHYTESCPAEQLRRTMIIGHGKISVATQTMILSRMIFGARITGQDILHHDFYWILATTTKIDPPHAVIRNSLKSEKALESRSARAERSNRLRIIISLHGFVSFISPLHSFGKFGQALN